MPVPHISEAFVDLLDPRFQKIYHDTLKELPDMVPVFYNMEPNNGRNTMTFSQVGTLDDLTEFTGSINYGSQNQGYDTTITPVEFAGGIQVERKLYDDDQFNIMDQKPRGLAQSEHRTRQKHAARMLINAFSVDNYFYNNSEGVALCSDSHTTTSGASTAAGFDNQVTSSLTATAVAAARIQFVGFRGDQAERYSGMPNEIWHPPELYEEAFEITTAAGKLDTANNNPNVHKGRYTTHEWEYLTDANNWFMTDSFYRKQMVHWVDRIPAEMAMIEDFDTLLAKWRLYGRWANGHSDWRWIIGSQVT